MKAVIVIGDQLCPGKLKLFNITYYSITNFKFGISALQSKLAIQGEQPDYFLGWLGQSTLLLSFIENPSVQRIVMHTHSLTSCIQIRQGNLNHFIFSSSTQVNRFYLH